MSCILPTANGSPYAVGSELFKRPLVGGSPVRLAENTHVVPNQVGLDWLDDGTILYEEAPLTVEPEFAPRRLVQIPEDGGETLVVFWPEAGEGTPVWVHGLPDGRGALVATCVTTACAEAELHVVDLRDLSSELLLEEVRRAWYTPTGHLVYVRADGALFAVPFDLGALEIMGGAIPLFDGVRVAGGRVDMQLAADGTLLYVEGLASTGGSATPVWVDRDGTAREIDPGWRVQGYSNRSSLALSPDGTRLALSDLDSQGTWDLWVKQLDTGPLSRLTFEGDVNFRLNGRRTVSR